MIEDLTVDELAALEAATTEAEWNAVCDCVKAARGGEYPADWYEKVLTKGGVLTRFKLRTFCTRVESAGPAPPFGGNVVVVPSGVSDISVFPRAQPLKLPYVVRMLLRRAVYGGRKGRSALRRLRSMGARARGLSYSADSMHFSRPGHSKGFYLGGCSAAVAARNTRLRNASNSPT